MTTTHHIRIPGAGGEIAAYVDGPDGRPWIVLSNSLGTTHAMWEPQMAALTRRFRVLRYDTRGHGASAAPAGPYALDDLVGDAVGLMDHFGIARAAFIGLSLGGMTALGIGLGHPGRIERLVCCAARADSPPAYRAVWAERIATVRAEGLAGVVEGSLGRWFTRATHAGRPELIKRAREMILANDPGGYAGCCEALRRLDYLGRLPGLAVPALFVAGAEDPSATPALMRAMAAAVPGAGYAEVPAAAHIANMENPDAFDAAVLPFLDGRDAPPPEKAP